MMSKETADQLAEAVDKEFERRVDALKEKLRSMKGRSPEYDMVNAMKRTLGFLRKKYAMYRSMIYMGLALGQMDPDEPNQWALIMRTDIDQALGGETNPQDLLLIESDLEDGVEFDKRYASLDPDDVFMNAYESCTNSIPDDTLLATNFVMFLDKVHYRVAECRVDHTPAYKMVVMTMVKGRNVIRLRYNVTVPLNNAQKNIEFIHKCQTSL